MKRINLNISDQIYQQLDESAKTNGQSKTYIIETALKQYFGSHADESTSMQIEPNLDNLDEGNIQIDRSSEIEKLKTLVDKQQEQIERLDKNQHESQEKLKGIESHLEGLSCSIKGEKLINQQMLDERLAKQEKRIDSNQKDITRLQDTYPEVCKDYETHKWDIRELKQEVQNLKIHRVTHQEHYNLQQYTKYLREAFNGLSCPLDNNADIGSNDTQQNEPSVTSDDSTEDNKPKQDEPSESSDKPQQEVTLTKMGKMIGGMSRYKVETCVEGTATKETQQIYDEKIEPYYYWDSKKQKFYSK